MRGFYGEVIKEFSVAFLKAALEGLLFYAAIIIPLFLILWMVT